MMKTGIVTPVSSVSPVTGQLLRKQMVDQPCLTRGHAYITPPTHTHARGRSGKANGERHTLHPGWSDGDAKIGLKAGNK